MKCYYCPKYLGHLLGRHRCNIFFEGIPAAVIQGKVKVCSFLTGLNDTRLDNYLDKEQAIV